MIKAVSHMTASPLIHMRNHQTTGWKQINYFLLFDSFKTKERKKPKPFYVVYK